MNHSGGLSHRVLPNSASSAFNQPGSDHPRRARHDSFSGSESSSPYSQYQNASSGDLDTLEEDAALIAQSLNADGTPKRPMNAFMIYARKRRPEVSAANQTMRTGDISKILSKEWNTMEMADKQYYLDQAKKLKDNFNAKYPDYVYRRRPNNSRKRRRTDGAMNRPPDSPYDVGEDLPVGIEFSEHSPIEGDEAMRYLPDFQYPGHSGASPLKDEDNEAAMLAHLRATNYGYEGNYNPYGSPPFSAGTTIHQPHPYHSHSHSHSLPHRPSSVYSPSEPNSGHWTGSSINVSRVNQGRWPGLTSPLNTGGTTQHEPSSLGISSVNNPDLYSPRSWSSSASSASSSAASVASGPAVHASGHPFPTLNSPFYPHPGHSPGNQSEDATPHAGSPQNYYAASSPHAHFVGRQHGGSAYEHQNQGGGGGYTQQSPTVGGAQPSYLTAGVHHGDVSPVSRTPGLASRPHPISTYGLPHPQYPMTPSPAGSAHSAHMAYWDKDKVEGS